MNLQQLEYIVALDRLGSFTKSADHCNVTQATLSTMVKRLEEELGIVLFDRRVNAVQTTEQGKAIVEESRLLLQQEAKIKDLAYKLKGVVKGKLSLAVIPTIANALLPKILKPLTEAFPLVELSISELTTANIIKKLKEGKLDAGIVATPLNEPEIEEFVMYYEALMVYGDGLKGRQYTAPEDIKDHKLWMLEEGHCLRDQMMNLCGLKKKSKLPLNVHFEANSFDTLLNMVDSFGGLTLIPELYYNTLPIERKAKVTQFVKPQPVREVSMIYYRPLGKSGLIDSVAAKISELVKPELLTASIAPYEQSIIGV